MTEENIDENMMLPCRPPILANAENVPDAGLFLRQLNQQVIDKFKEIILNSQKGTVR